MEFGIKGSSMIVGVGVLSLSRKQLFIKISSLEAATQRERLPAKPRECTSARLSVLRNSAATRDNFKSYLLATNDR